MRLLFRPIDEWPGSFTTSRKTPQFSATWSDTLEILERELLNLGATEAVIQVAADERAMRMDGGLRADAKVSHPGVILSFETKKYGPMRLYRAKSRRRACDLQVHPPAGPEMIMRWPHDCST